MPAVIEATREMVRRATRPETPVRLRLWTAVATVLAAALLATVSLLMGRVQDQVRIIADEAAPQAATAADLYFALSDLDAQVARMVLTAGADELAGSQIDALGAYQRRSRQVDADVQRSLGAGADRAVTLELLGHLAVYRERVWQALTAGGGAPGYYTQATNVLHLDLLPAAERLRQASEKRLRQAYARKGATEVWGVTLSVVLGAALAAVLLILQVWLARRFRRTLNPALITATVLTVALVVPAVIVLAAQARRLDDARDQSLTPLLALSRARAVSYDAAADTSRFLISDRLAFYDEDFARKSDCLTSGGVCDRNGPAIDGGLRAVAGGPDVSPARTEQVTRRWLVYARDHERIVSLAGAGSTDAAVGALTGIGRGDAAFDFSYFDAAVGEIATERRESYDAALRDAETLLRGWRVIPLVVMGLVMSLVPLAVRRRLAEYR